ncbi:tetratricopeptide repeat protein [Hankyongella ginsenosidimutans]|uniref:Tetratricopeptide repeat protein n=1 Tax=Hankyongella ginsenosidimutans TaxID=1763828 RepID=A0A4D7C5L2_9SPHN|nr:tetratricopeptide repeat protein [Hankyongella ginsenosidimutans]
MAGGRRHPGAQPDDARQAGSPEPRAQPVIRLVVVFMPLGALALLLAWAANQPGYFRLAWFGWVIQTRAVVALLILMIGMALAAALMWLAMTLRWRARLYRSGRTMKRLQDGHLIATQALAALKVDRPEAAAKLAGRPRAGPDDPVALYVAACGGDGVAQHRLDADKRTALLGAIARGQPGAAVEALEELARMAPDSAPAWRNLFKTRARAGDWSGAVAALDKWRKLDRDAQPNIQHRRAGVCHAAALDAEKRGDTTAAARWRRDAVRASLSFAPAVAAQAEVLTARGKTGQGSRLLMSAWQDEPNPLIAQAYAALDPTETPAHRLGRMTALVNQYPSHPESRLTLAEAALAAGQPRKAIEALHPISSPPMRARTARVLAEAYRQLGDVMPDYVSAALTGGVPEPNWHCHTCGDRSTAWVLVCPSCGDVGNRHWE